MAIYFYFYKYVPMVEGAQNMNQTSLKVGSSLKQSEFITSANNRYIFGLFGDKVGIYKLPKNPKKVSEQDSEGLTQEDLIKNPSSIVPTKSYNGKTPDAIVLNTNGISIYNGSDVLWSLSMSDLSKDSTVFLNNKGKLKVQGKPGSYTLDGGKTDTSDDSGAKTLLEQAMENIYNKEPKKYESLDMILKTIYYNSTAESLNNFREAFETAINKEDHSSLQNKVYKLLSDLPDEDKEMLTNAVISKDVFGTQSFCEKYSNDVYNYSITSENPIDFQASYGDVNASYNNIINSLSPSVKKDLTSLYGLFYVNALTTNAQKQKLIMNLLQTTDVVELLERFQLIGVLKTFCKEGFGCMKTYQSYMPMDSFAKI